MIKVCMFDMGGVVDLFDGSEMERKLLRYFGVSDHDTFLSLSPDLKEVIRDFGAGMFDEVEYWKRFSDITGVVVPNEPNLYTKFFNPVQNPQTLEIIDELKSNGLRVIAGTNVEPSHRMWHDARNDYGIFDYAYTSDRLHCVKPEPAFFSKIIEAENVSPDEVFFTDDRQENIDVANSLGVNGFLFRSPQSLREHLKEIGLI